jgi:hypothetical protein
MLEKSERALGSRPDKQAVPRKTEAFENQKENRLRHLTGLQIAGIYFKRKRR